MNLIYLTPESIPMLAKCLLAIIITGYILIYFEKTKPIKWFIGYLIGYTFLDIFALIGEVVLYDWAQLSLPLQYLASISFTYCYLQFAYHFKENSFPKEHRRATIIVSIITIPAVLYSIYLMFKIGYGDYTAVQALLPYPLFLICWSAVVFYRKYQVASKEDSKENIALANKSFFIITILAIIISLTPALRALELIGHAFFTVSFFILNLAVFSILTATAINYLAKQTTVLIKLVGVSLVMFVSIIGLQGFLILPEYKFQTGEEISIEERVDVHAKVIPFVWFLFGTSGAVLTLFPVFYSRSVLRPLRRLLDGVNQLNEGNLDINLPVWNKDEFGIVTVHFNNMAKNLSIANDELQEYAQDLEEKVNDRTKRLNTKTQLLEQKTLQLEEMEQFRSKLFMDISHELRTPITLISGPLQTLLNKHNFDEDTKSQLELSLQNSERLKALVEQIIDLNRLETNQLVLQISPIDVCKHLKFITSSFESFLTLQKLEFSCKIPNHPIELYLDSDKFEKIITNLISNASKYTHANGLISISLTETQDSVSIQVSDTGIGISSDKLTSIFERHQTKGTTSSEYKQGLGVGLSIIKKYVALHGGKITVESTKGVGSTFTVTFKKGNQHLTNIQMVDSSLPVTNKTENYSALNQNKPVPDSPNNPSKKTILIIEDNKDIANFYSSVLKTEGFNTIFAENGEIALTLLKDKSPDLIISDIMMPVMDGFEFLEQLNKIEKFSLTPTILVSARSDIEGKLLGFNLGINDYLVKPFNVNELLCRITNLLNFSDARKSVQINLTDESSKSIDQQLIDSLTTLVEEQMHDSNFNIDKLATEVSMSRSTLYREIKKATGFSAAAFVKEIRLQKAKQKLENGLAKNISELSYEIGFSTPSYFSKMYKNRFGKTPSEYLT